MMFAIVRFLLYIMSAAFMVYYRSTGIVSDILHFHSYLKIMAKIRSNICYLGSPSHVHYKALNVELKKLF